MFILLILKVLTILNYKINIVNNIHNCNKSLKTTTKSSFNTITKITKKTEITVKIKDNITNYSYFKLNKVNNMLKYFPNNKKVVNNEIIDFVEYINKKNLKITKYSYLNTYNLSKFLIFSKLINYFI